MKNKIEAAPAQPSQHNHQQGQLWGKAFDLQRLQDCVLSPERPDPLDLHSRPNEGRLPEYIAVRYGRMLENEFTFFRGSAAAMAFDLGHLPRSQVTVQLCGDVHLLNFGVFASPERQLMFDLNDFDETLSGPFEWDLLRLATSALIAARVDGMSEAQGLQVARHTARAYREQLELFAGMSHQEVWYHHVDSEKALEVVHHVETRLKETFKAARKRTARKAVDKMAVLENGVWQFKNDPPELVLLPEQLQEDLQASFADYLQSLQSERQTLLKKYTLVDAAFKLTGIGSAGRRVYLLLLQGNSSEDVVILQFKQAMASSLEASLGADSHVHHGERIVAGQRLMQANSDLFLGWATLQGHDYYVRQLRDMKGTVDLEGFDLQDLTEYSGLCAYVLARAHARSADASLIAGFLEGAVGFDEGVARFAQQYAAVNQQDMQALLKAEAEGKLKVERGV